MAHVKSATTDVAEIENEIDALSRELACAVGLHRRDRRAASRAERARLNASRAIKVAIDRIAENVCPIPATPYDGDSETGLLFCASFTILRRRDRCT
jgi:hypothetical protein